MSIKRESAKTIFQFIVQDFESAWSALVATKDGHVGCGNFMFALLSMILLELACRVCAKDKSNKKLTNLTNALTKIEPRYFTRMPGVCTTTRGFTLPGNEPHSHLLSMMFDLVRHGKAHQYQSAIVTLPDGEVDIDLTGAEPGCGLTGPRRLRPTKHLCYSVSTDGDLSLYVRTDQLFLDIKGAIDDSGIISDSDVVTDIIRPKSGENPRASALGPKYGFTVAKLEEYLNAGKHQLLKATHSG